MQSTHRPRKRFGQHFLHDEHVIEQIIACIAPTPIDRVVEIGPGLGALTEHLLRVTGHLDVIELDRDVIPPLLARCGKLGELNVHAKDVLKFNFHDLVNNEQSLRIVGNLPYNISTPLLFHLIKQIDTVQDMHFMFQKEVARRIAAPPGDTDYGRLSIMVQYECKCEFLFEIGPYAFHPPPKIDSAVIRLTPHAPKPWIAKDETGFAKLVNQAFTQRRKTLNNALKNLARKTHFERAGIDGSLRPEVLSIEQFVRLSNVITDMREHGTR